VAIPGRQVGLVVLALGALLVVVGAVQWWHDERVFARMRATNCTLLSKKVEEKLSVASKRRVAGPRAWYTYDVHLVFAHTLQGRQYTFTEDFREHGEPSVHAGFEEGKTYPCRYDPQNPRYGTVTGMSDDWGTLPIGIALMALGAVTALPRA
jgi:Protein of unknown function (DUF3592)